MIINTSDNTTTGIGFINRWPETHRRLLAVILELNAQNSVTIHGYHTATDFFRLQLPRDLVIRHPQASAAGACRHKACELLGIAPRTLERWRQCGGLMHDARTTRAYVPENKLSDQERDQGCFVHLVLANLAKVTFIQLLTADFGARSRLISENSQ